MHHPDLVLLLLRIFDLRGPGVGLQQPPLLPLPHDAASRCPLLAVVAGAFVAGSLAFQKERWVEGRSQACRLPRSLVGGFLVMRVAVLLLVHEVNLHDGPDFLRLIPLSHGEPGIRSRVDGGWQRWPRQLDAPRVSQWRLLWLLSLPVVGLGYWETLLGERGEEDWSVRSSRRLLGPTLRPLDEAIRLSRAEVPTWQAPHVEQRSASFRLLGHLGRPLQALLLPQSGLGS